MEKRSQVSLWIVLSTVLLSVVSVNGLAASSNWEGNMKRSAVLLILFTFVSAFIFTTMPLQAQPYPNRPIQYIIPFVPGGGGDLAARTLAEDLGRVLGTPVVPINKPGAGFTLGTDAVAKARKDGYTIGYTNGPAIIQARILNPETVPYDPDKDLEALGLHVFFPLAVAVRGDSPWKTFNELIEYAKKNPEKVSASLPGIGSASHFNLEITQSLTDVRFTAIPFKGGQSGVTQLLGGHVDIIYESFGNILPHFEAGKLRVLLTTKKIPASPGVPTLTELGYKQDLFSGWQALYAPAGIPEEVKRTLVAAAEKAIKNPESKTKLEKLGYVVDYKSPADLIKAVSEEYNAALSLALKIGLRK
jgi:tripartite-type tricarboxylate transporter receptor subunit TctC